MLVERYERLGGVCLNVGCIPSKALLHVARVLAESEEAAAQGITFGEPQIDLDGVRDFKDGAVEQAHRRPGRHGQGPQGAGRRRAWRSSPGRTRSTSTARRSAFEHCIIAAGSHAVKLPGFPDDPRIVDSTGALELPEVPERLLVIGGGIIGLEMATVYDALGSKVTVVEMLDQLIPGADPDLVKPLHKRISEALRGDPPRAPRWRRCGPRTTASVAKFGGQRGRRSTASSSPSAGGPTAPRSAPTRRA